MPPKSGRDAVVAYGRQTAEGTALTTPKYEHAMGAGGIQPARSVQELPWTTEGRDRTGFYVERVSGDFQMDLPVLPRSSVAFVLSAFGTRTTSGVGPYTHDETFADALPWYTWFFTVGDEYLKLADAKTNTLSLSGSAGSPLGASISGMGKTTTRNQPAAKWGAATVEEGVDPHFTFINATVKLEASTTPAATTVHNVPSFDFTVNNNLEAIQTDDEGYTYIVEGKREVSLSLGDVVLEDWNFVNTVFFGSTTGTAVSTQPVYGSAEITCIGSDAVAAATRSIKIITPRMLFSISQYPGADPSGAPVRYALDGMVAKPTSGSSATVTVVNSDAGTDY